MMGKRMMNGEMVGENPYRREVRMSDNLPSSERTYCESVVGESFYQTAIANCLVGDPVTIAWETDNRFDDHALVILHNEHDPIGYIARDSWLQDAIWGEGKCFTARIDSLGPSAAGLIGVVIAVDRCEGRVAPWNSAYATISREVREKDRQAAERTVEPAPDPSPGWFSRLFR